MFKNKPDPKTAFSHAQKTGVEVVLNPECPGLRIHDLSINRPDGTLLIKPFSLELKPGERLMISGASGCGKSTIILAIRGHSLWPWATGKVEMNPTLGELTIGQKPHLPLTTLKGIISSPDFAHQHTDEEAAAALQKAGLGMYATDMNDESKNGVFWEKLSGGEKQRLGFAAIFLLKRKILKLDEVTASLDAKAQDELYKAVVQGLPDCVLISISHRMELAPYHNRHAVIENQEFVFRNPHPVPVETPSQCPICNHPDPLRLA